MRLILLSNQKFQSSGFNWNLMIPSSQHFKMSSCTMEHRTYLWLKLMVDVIRSELELTKNRLKRVINTLPATIDQAYEAILSKAKDQRKARKILHIIVAAMGPLTLKEISYCL